MATIFDAINYGNCLQANININSACDVNCHATTCATTCVATNTITISMDAAIKDISSASACHTTNGATICITAALVVVPQQPKWGILHVVSNDGVCLQDTITINASITS